MKIKNFLTICSNYNKQYKFITITDLNKIKSLVAAEIEEIPAAHNRIKTKTKSELLWRKLFDAKSRMATDNIIGYVYTYSSNLGNRKFPDFYKRTEVYLFGRNDKQPKITLKTFDGIRDNTIVCLIKK